MSSSVKPETSSRGENVKFSTLRPGQSWADDLIERSEKTNEKMFNDEKSSKEFQEILGMLNSENSNLRRGALKALLTFVVVNTKVSKTDVRSVCQDNNPTVPVLRNQAMQPQVQVIGSRAAKTSVDPKLKLLRPREVELRGLFPDFKQAGEGSDYALYKRRLHEVYKSGFSVKGALPKTLVEFNQLPLERI